MWIPHPDAVWQGATLCEDYTGQSTLPLVLSDGQVRRSCIVTTAAK